jgi:hypothetical protein
MSALGQKRTSRRVYGMSALPPKADMGTQSRDVRFVPKSDIASLDRSPRRRRRLGDYSRKDAKSCDAIPAKRFLAPPIRQGGERRVQSVGLEWDSYGTVFEHTASYINRVMHSQIFPLRR